jgi:hypothetical protein
VCRLKWVSGFFSVAHASVLENAGKFLRQKLESKEPNIMLTILRETGVVTLIEEDKLGGFFFGSTTEIWKCNRKKNLKALGIQFYKIFHYSRLAFCLFCAFPPFVKLSPRAHYLVAMALFMLCLGQNHA